MSDGEGFFPATSMPDEAWWRVLWPDPEAVLRATGLEPGMAAVDLCCGNGWFTAPMARIAGAGRVLAIDLDPAMTAAAEARLRGEGLPWCRFITGDARRMNEALEGRVDYILIANTFHGVPDKAGLAACAARALKPGGRLVIINWHARRREETQVLGRPRGPATELRMTPEETVHAVAPCGLVAAGVVELPPFHYAALFTRPPGREAGARGGEKGLP